MAALAADGWGIGCIADKSLSYEGYFQWDSDSSKMFHLNPSGAVVMFAGSDEGTSRVIGRLMARETEIGKKIPDTIKLCEEEYKAALDELTEAYFLRPRLLTRQEYIAAISGPSINPYIRSIAKEINAYNMQCSLIVCGFEMIGSLPRRPYILAVSHPGIVTDMTRTGFHAIGTGWDKAIAHLMFSEYERSHDVGRVLYELFDAKAYAELDANVGYEWELKVLTLGTRNPRDVPKEIKELIEKGWAKANRSPFYKREKGDLENPPKNWKTKLEAYGVGILVPPVTTPSDSQTSKGQQ